MKLAKIAAAFLLGTLLVAGVACADGGSASKSTPTPTPITIIEGIYGKSTYAVGETVEFRIAGEVEVIEGGTEEQMLPYYIRESSGETLKLKHSCSGFVGEGWDQYCVNGTIARVVVDVSCGDALQFRQETVNTTYTWDQKAFRTIEEQCEGQSIRREVLEQVPAGKYEIVVRSVNWNSGDIKQITIK